jgi:chromosome segregation ATPase
MPRFIWGDFFELEERLNRQFDRLQEDIVALAESVNTLGALVQKVVVDGATTKQMITDLRAEIDRLVAQGSANQSELDALKASVAVAVPAIDANNALLQQLDDQVQDPTTPLDPATPVALDDDSPE